MPLGKYPRLLHGRLYFSTQHDPRVTDNLNSGAPLWSKIDHLTRREGKEQGGLRKGSLPLAWESGCPVWVGSSDLVCHICLTGPQCQEEAKVEYRDKVFGWPL